MKPTSLISLCIVASVLASVITSQFLHQSYQDNTLLEFPLESVHAQESELSANPSFAGIFIDQTGNVGIGTQTPISALNVVGSLTLAETSSSSLFRTMNLYTHGASNGQSCDSVCGGSGSCLTAFTDKPGRNTIGCNDASQSLNKFCLCATPSQ